MDLFFNGYLIKTPIPTIIKQLKSELRNGKLKEIDYKNDEIIVTCPNDNHKGGKEDSPSCGICIDPNNKNYGRFHCFTCNFSGKLDQFIASCLDISKEDARLWLIDRFGGEQIESSIMNLEDINLNSKPIPQYIDDKVLDSFQSYHPYMEKRKLSKDICKLFEVKYDPKSKCLVFPVRDDRGNLYMLTKRSVNTKFFYIDENKEKPLYLYHYIKKNNIREVTIVESQINCLTLFSYGIPSIACFGTGTTYQHELINKSNLTHIYLALDGDEAGRRGTIRWIRSIKPSIIVDVILIPPGKDVNDLTQDEFNNLPIIDSQEYLKRYQE